MSEDKKPLTKETVYIDIEDDITAMIDKVEQASAKVVALVLPKRSTTLQSTVNMRLLKRSSEKAGKNVVLITSEAAILPLAGAVGLHVAKNLQSAPEVPDTITETAAPEAPDVDEVTPPKAKLDYAKPMGALAADKDDEEPDTIDLEDKTEEEPEPETKPVKKAKPTKQKGLHIPNFDSFRNRMALIIMAIVALILFFIIGGKVLPKATITLQTTSEPVSASVNLTTSDKAKKLDLENNVIPAQLKTTDQTSTQQVTATGQKNLGQKASGTVNLHACEKGLALPSSVPAGSLVTTSSGSTFVTQADTTFSNSGTPNPGGGCFSYQSKSSTPIKAQNPGSSYNVSSANFTVSSRSDVTGTGSTSEGTDNNVTVLSQNDVNKAVADASKGDSSDLVKKFKAGLTGEGFYLIDETFKTGKAAVTATPAVGQQTSSSSVTIKITYSVLVVKKDDLSKAVTAALNKQIDTSHQKLSTTDVLKDADVSLQSKSSATTVSLSVTERTTAVPQLDQTAIKKDIAGKKSGDIQSALQNLPGVKSVSVNLSPFWVSKAPTNPSKIHIIMQEVTTTNQSSGQQP